MALFSSNGPHLNAAIFMVIETYIARRKLVAFETTTVTACELHGEVLKKIVFSKLIYLQYIERTYKISF